MGIVQIMQGKLRELIRQGFSEDDILEVNQNTYS